jgi:hypothetical protein
MSRREFANLKELQDFARRNRKLYALDRERVLLARREEGDAIPEGGPESGVGGRWDQAAQGKGTLVRTIMAARVLPARAPYQRSPTRAPLAC